MSKFAHLPKARPDAAFALVEAYKADKSPHKVDLSPGFYRDEDAKPWILPSVRMAKEALQSDTAGDHEHLPILGHTDLLNSARELVFHATAEDAASIASIQTIAGTGANHLGALLLAKSSLARTVWISNLSWINHHEIWQLVDSSIDRQVYPYFDEASFTIDFERTVSTLKEKAREGDIVVLHGCGHNPTGIDFSKDQWKILSGIFEEKKLFAFFDLAYQGFASGDLDEDAWSVRHFFRNTSLEMMVAQSFSKNFGLYGERVGVLHVVCRSESVKPSVLAALGSLARAEITTPPINGAKIVAKVLGDEDLREQWQRDLIHMSGRMTAMRQRLVTELRKRQTPGSWDHILREVGMFSMTGLQPEQVQTLREKYHVYLLPSGRISLTGLTEHNVEYVAEVFNRVILADTP